MFRPSSALSLVIGLAIVAGTASGCGRQSPVQPTPAEPPAVPVTPLAPVGTPPTVVSLSSAIGSTEGGTFVAIVGTGFRSGAIVRFGGVAVSGITQRTTSIYVTAPPHDAGPVDVAVINADGTAASLAGGYTYAPPESFDFNGDWAGVSFATDTALTFTIRADRLVSLSCGNGPALTFSPAPAVRHGAFAFADGAGTTITGRIVSPGLSIGTIAAPQCPASEWDAAALHPGTTIR
jgi:hypothetical protein